MTLSRRPSTLLVAALLAAVLAMANPAPALAAERTWQATVVLGTWPTLAGTDEVLVEAIPSGQVEPTASALTDAAGQVTFTLRDDIAYSVRYTYLGSGLFNPRPQSTGIYQDQQFLRIPAVHTISGRVFLGSESRPALPGEVRVSALIGGESHVESVTTDESGAYTLRLDPGTYVVRFDYVGDEPWADGRTPGVVYIQDASKEGVDATLQPASIIAGTVRDSGGGAIGGATVTANAREALTDGTWLSYTATTDGSGAFRMDSIGPGDYEVWITAEGFVPVRWPGVTYTEPELIDLTAPSVRRLDATVHRPASITGKVTVDGLTPDQYSDGSVYAELQFRDPERATWTMVQRSPIAADGGYRLGGLLPGEYRVRAGYSGPRGLTADLSPTFTMAEGELRTWNTRTLSPTVGLQPGVLVKGSGADVYLVDGPTELVRLTSFSTAQDLGIPTSYSVVPDAQLDDYEIDFRPLSNLVSCDGGQLGSGGRLYWITWKEFPYSPRSELDPSTCDRLAVTGERFSGYLSSGGRVWYADEEEAGKHEVLGASGVGAHPVNDAFLGTLPTGTPRVVAGGLLKFDDQSAVYLANGYSRLTRLTSFATVSDMGLPTSFTTRPAVERAEYEVDEHTLRNAVHCNGTSYVGANGGAWPVSADVAAGLPVSELTGFACRRLPQRSPAITEALLLKGPTSPVVFHVADGTKSAVASMAEAERLSAPQAPNFLTVRPEYLELLPTVAERLTPGTLVKSAAQPMVYLVDGDLRLIPVSSFGTVAALGLPTSYRVVSDAAIAARTVAPRSLGVLVSCDGATYLGLDGRAWPAPDTAVAGLSPLTLDPETCAAMQRQQDPLGGLTLMKAAGEARVWALVEGRLRPVTTMSSLQNLQGRYGLLRQVDPSFVAETPKGQPVFAPKTLVKASDGPDIYVVDGFSGLVRLPSFELALDMGAGPVSNPSSLGFETVPRADLGAYSVGASQLTNVATCAGAHYFLGNGAMHEVSSSLVAGLATTALADETCRLGDTSLRATPIFVKSRSSSTVFMLSDGLKRRVESWDSVVDVSRPHAAIAWAVNDAFLASLNRGPDVLPSGTLVKTSGDPTVYVVDGPFDLQPLATFESARAFGLSTAYRQVPEGTLAGIQRSQVVLDALASCEGGLWLASAGKRWPLPEHAVEGMPVAGLSDALCSHLPRANQSLTSKPFVKSAASTTIYALDNGTKRPVTSFEALVAIADGHPVIWVEVRDGFLSSIPTGAPISS